MVWSPLHTWTPYHSVMVHNPAGLHDNGAVQRGGERIEPSNREGVSRGARVESARVLYGCWDSFKISVSIPPLLCEMPWFFS